MQLSHENQSLDKIHLEFKSTFIEISTKSVHHFFLLTITNVIDLSNANV